MINDLNDKLIVIIVVCNENQYHFGIGTIQ